MSSYSPVAAELPAIVCVERTHVRRSEAMEARSKSCQLILVHHGALRRRYFQSDVNCRLLQVVATLSEVCGRLSSAGTPVPGERLGGRQADRAGLTTT